MTANIALDELKRHASSERAESAKWFFKTAKGQYGEGDKFLGVSVPNTRKVARKYKDLSIAEIVELLKDPLHEARLMAVFMLVQHYQLGDETIKKSVYDTYISNTKHINNWDIVDSSAHKIVGPYLANKPYKIKVLTDLAKSNSLWERRIAIISTAYNIAKLKSAYETLLLAEMLINDKEDLIHKAVGWMLREIGIYIDESILIKFLDEHAKVMPRTMLRYSIEKLNEATRKHYLSIKKV